MIPDNLQKIGNEAQKALLEAMVAEIALSKAAAALGKFPDETVL